MASKAATPEQYIDELPDDRKEPIRQLRKVILKNIPKGFKEMMSYGMIGYVVPHTIYPDGYHCNPALPVPFITLGSQKNAITIHHLGIYGDKKLLDWFLAEYPKHSTAKIDMGKGCIRFKKPDQIPYKLIGELVSKITVEKWISFYESTWK